MAGHNDSHGQMHVHEHCLKMARREDGTPWWAEFPEPRSTPSRVEPERVRQLLQDRERASERHKPRDFLLVDARRTDCTGGMLRGAMNLPAHSFYPARKVLYELCKQAGIKRVIFYCGGSPSP
jgi:arsenical-resistance protein 2